MKTILLRALLCYLGILACVGCAFLVAGWFATVRSSGMVEMWFVPLAVAGWGVLVQRRFRWGMPVALWTLLLLAVGSYAYTAWSAQAGGHELLNLRLLGYVGLNTVLIGLPWMAGTGIGLHWREELEK